LKKYSDEFKRKIIFEIIENKKTPLQVAYEYNVPIELIEKWQREFLEKKDKDKSSLKLFLDKKIVFIPVFLIFFVGICFLTGCFANKSNETTKIIQKKIKKENFEYKNFVDSWNKMILHNQYFATFKTKNILLPSDDKKVIQKLNQIFNPQRIKNQIKYYQKKLTGNELIDLPIKEYIKFLKSLNFKANRFSEKMSSDEIVKTVLFMMNSENKYLSFKTFQQLVWTYSFKKYFKDNLSKFEKQGFSKNLENYNKYIRLVK
jgi:hypothetical protein